MQKVRPLTPVLLQFSALLSSLLSRMSKILPTVGRRNERKKKPPAVSAAFTRRKTQVFFYKKLLHANLYRSGAPDRTGGWRGFSALALGLTVNTFLCQTETSNSNRSFQPLLALAPFGNGRMFTRRRRVSRSGEALQASACVPYIFKTNKITGGGHLRFNQLE